jgi:hypothetical protein
LRFPALEPHERFTTKFFAKKVGGLNGIRFIGGTKNHPVAKIQRQHFGFVITEWRDERCGGLRGGDNRCARFADHVHAIVIARAVLAGRHKALRFVRPQDEQIIFGTFQSLICQTGASAMIVKSSFKNVFT